MGHFMLDLVEEQSQVHRRLREFLQTRQPVEEDLPRELREVLACIHQHLFDAGLNVKSVKKKCGIRTNNISSRFRWQMGIGLRDYIEVLRMEAADHLLRTTEVGIFDLAMCLGYEHESTFYRAFQRQFECSPSVHRTKCQERRTRANPRPRRRAELEG